MPDFQRTDDVVSPERLTRIVGGPQRGKSVMAVCAGEWRKERIGQLWMWRFWSNPEWEE